MGFDFGYDVHVLGGLSDKRNEQKGFVYFPYSMVRADEQRLVGVEHQAVLNKPNCLGLIISNQIKKIQCIFQRSSKLIEIRMFQTLGLSSPKKIRGCQNRSVKIMMFPQFSGGGSMFFCWGVPGFHSDHSRIHYKVGPKTSYKWGW